MRTGLPVAYAAIAAGAWRPAATQLSMVSPKFRAD
jgi:hypothetical protein